MKNNVSALCYRFFLCYCVSVLLICFTSCSRDEQALEQGYLIDQEGKQIPTVKIGGQWWMAEDLRVTHYRNGQAVSQIQSDSSLWNNDTNGAYVELDSSTFLYNGYAVTSQNELAPEGWHIATDDDWKQLELFIGMSGEDLDKTNWRSQLVGDKLKIRGVEHWVRYANIWGEDVYRFAARPNNCRMFDSRPTTPIGYGYMGFWWSSSESSGGQRLWYRHLDYKKTGIFRYHGQKTYGFSVRCVRNQ